jgi:putative SOS response-associated peptidase YedK
MEWKSHRAIGGKTPYRILLRGGQLFTFAGVWTRGSDGGE